MKMTEYIDREKVIDVICRLIAEVDDVNEGMYSEEFLNGYQAGLELAELRVNDIPAADVCPEKHGAWSDKMVGVRDEMFLGDFHFGFKCSECGAVLNKTNYCGNCGAKMDGKENENNVK